MDVDVTVVVVTWQARELLAECLASLAAQTVPADVVVVDNASNDGTADWLAEHASHVRLVPAGCNRGFAGGASLGLAVATTPWVAILNNDAVAKADWLERLLAAATASASGRPAAVTSHVLLADGLSVNSTGNCVTRGGRGFDRDWRQPATAVRRPAGEVFGFCGAAALLERAAVEAAGGFDDYLFLYYEDTDLSWRLRLAGWDIRYEPAAVVHHAHSATVDQTSDRFAFFNERNRLLMLTRCAPASRARRAVFRFVLTTASLGLKRALRRPVPDVPVFSTGLRLRVLRSYARALPWALRTRRTIRRSAAG